MRHSVEFVHIEYINEAFIRIGEPSHFLCASFSVPKMLQNIDCGYSLEPPRRGGSNEYTQSMFWSKNKKNRGGSNEYPQSMFWSKNKKNIKIFQLKNSTTTKKKKKKKKKKKQTLFYCMGKCS